MTDASEDAAWVNVGSSNSLAATGRLHVCIKGRYVSILKVQGGLTCIDSICFHAGGPLGLGDIEDINGKTCLICPWHDYKIDVLTGEKYYQSVTWDNGKMVPGPWKSNGPRHRIHKVEERTDGCVYVQLDSTPVEMPSDGYAFNHDCGLRVLSCPNTATAQSSAHVGADGKWTPTWLLSKLTGP